MKKYILLIMFINVCSGADYFVSVQGNDENPGTINSPFQTIQKAADIVEGGDVVNIMEGLYREQITLDGVSGSDGAPILFKSFDNDRVLIDGTKLISTAWTAYQGNIWKTQIDFDVWQLFLDRKEQVMARWPNANFDDGSIWDKENHWAHGTMDQSQEPAYENGTLIDKPHENVDLSSIGFSVVDAIAILNVGSFRTWTRKINTHSGNTITYDLVPDNEWKVKHHDYYLEGKIEFLDSEGEWFFDTSDKMLYFWPPQGQDPNELSIRGKVQSYAFNILNSNYVEIHGLEFFGTTFQFDNCDYSKVENCNLWYPSCHKRMLGITDTQPDMSVFRSSSHCKVSKSAFRYTDGSALEMYSHNNTIEDCYFYHIDYSVTDLNSLMTTIQMGGANNIIRRNTMHKLGASATLNPGDASLITLNNISDTGHMQGDGAMVQVMTGQAPGTEISYNWLHSSVKYGARFDGNGTGNNGIMHHNVMWGLENSGIMAKGFEFKIFNNTVIDGPENKNDILVMIAQGGNEGTLTHNNVADRISGHRSGSYEDYPVPGIYTHNVNGYEIGRSVRGMLIDPDNLNFRPHPDSMLVDAGLVIEGFTDEYVGIAPDIGAYEYGGEYWIPGITWNVADTFNDEFIDLPVLEVNQDTVKWVSTFAQVNDIRSVSPTDDGGSIMISTYTDENSDRFMWLTKLDAYGDLDWNKNLGYFDQVTNSYSFEGYDVTQTSDGGYALIGSWLNGSTWERNNIQLVLTDSDGNEVDTESWGFSSHGSVGKSIIQTDDGGFVIAAQQDNSSIVVFKTDSTLISCNNIFNNCMHDGGGTAEKWGLQISYSSIIVVEEVIQTPDGGYAVLASNMWIGNNHSGIIVKISNTGSIEWQRSYNTGYRTVFYGIDNTHDGGFIVSGYERATSTSFPYDESLFLKIDGDGNIIWEKTFNTNSNDWPVNIKTLEDGTYISAIKYYGLMEGSMYSSDIRIVNLDTDGDLLWSFDYTGEFNRDIRANHIAIAPDLNFLIVGAQEDGENSSNFEGWATKLGTEAIIIPNPDDPDSPNLNDPPTTLNESLTVLEDSILDIPFTASDINGDMITYNIANHPLYGSIDLFEDTGFVYTPFNNFFGLDSFTYVAFDGIDYSEPATISINVSEVNDKPIAIDDHFMAAEDDTLYGNLHAEDGDYFPTQIEMQDLTYSITLSTLNGTLSVIDTSGEFTYTPDVNFFGADSFLFSVTDNGTTDGVADFLSDTAMIHLFVEPMNDAPVLSAFVDTSMHEDSTLVLTVFASDIDNAELSVYAYSSQDRVSAFIEDTLLYITPDADWNGTAEIVVVANDNMSRASDVEEFTVEVVPVNDPPFFTMDHFHAMGDITSGLEHWLYADDIDSDIFFTIEGAPSWLALDGSKMVGDPDQDGEYVFTLSVSDSEYVVSEQFVVHIADHRPEILSLRDVPNDQGKQMQIVWKPGQVNPSLLFTQFSTWRKVNPDSMQQDTADLWDFITTVPWIGTEDEYSLVVPTLGDSTAHGVHHSMFRVTAHTEDVELYHVSEPVAGFSIDNLHPTVPQGLMALESGSSVILQWTTQIEEDFSYHNIYRNDLNSFDPAMVFTTTDSFYVDEEGTQGSYEYWITAVDSAGNESDASDIAAVVLSASEQATVPTVFALEQNYPNPFNPSTQIRYALPEATSVVITVYDMMGRKVRTLVQDTQSAGYHTALWNATNDRGLPVSAGMYIYTLQAGDHHHMKKMVLLK